MVLTVAAVGLGSGEAEARFGKRSTPPPSSPPGGDRPSRPGGGYWGGNPYYYGNPQGYYAYYGYPWASYYYFDPAWAWPFLGAGLPSYGRYYGYGAAWRRLRPPPPPPTAQEMSTPPAALDLKVDTGAVANGYSVGLGLNVDGQRFGFGTRLDLFNLAAEEGMGRDSIALFSLGPSFLLVNNDRVKWRLTGGLDAAFAPDITMIGPGLGTSARLKVAGPLKLEASAHWTPLPYVQISGDAGVGVDLGSVLRLRAGYRATYLNDQGLVDGIVNRDLFAGPFVGLSLAP
ncbi:hypothetical protein BON30_19005 [Cystobacter ferrugineus]|uniref:Uncharacterized protein n=1 Tax=Cystobacter ferrugineus TaxID=83449 RepID=A0A1L9BBH2_9BACT|nr:hypothetical protein BON30_19005 [Cystobacter ferrugineus]